MSEDIQFHYSLLYAMDQQLLAMAIFLRRIRLYGCFMARYDAKAIMESDRNLL